MSASRQGSSGPNPSSLTIAEVQTLATFFKNLFSDNPLIKWSIVAAGIGGGLDVVHTFWLAARYVFRF